MEKINATLMDASSITDDTLVQNFTTFMEVITNAACFSTENIQLNITHGIGTVIVPMKKQHMIEDFLKTLTNILNINILYLTRSIDGSTYKMVAYTMPYKDEMYIVGMHSEQYGIIEEMIVTFFESLEIMFQWLHKSLEDIKNTKDHIIEQKSMTDLFRNFM